MERSITPSWQLLRSAAKLWAKEITPGLALISSPQFNGSLDAVQILALCSGPGCAQPVAGLWKVVPAFEPFESASA
jgi:hypothetical protein